MKDRLQPNAGILQGPVFEEAIVLIHCRREDGLSRKHLSVVTMCRVEAQSSLENNNRRLSIIDQVQKRR